MISGTIDPAFIVLSTFQPLQHASETPE